MRRSHHCRLTFSTLFCTLISSTVLCTTHAQEAVTPPPASNPDASPEPAAPSPVPPAEPAAPTQPAPAPAPPAATSAPAPTAGPEAEDPCLACANHHRRRSGDWMIGVMVGAGFFDLSGLNDRLAENGYERLDGPVIVIGGEGRGISPEGFVFGVHGAGIFGASGEGPGALETEWSGGYAMADFGYAPIRLRSFLLALTAGIGGYGVTLEIADNRQVDFDEVLESPRRQTSLTRGGIAFGLTLRMDARIPIGPVRLQHQNYLALGVRVSGLFGPAIGDWSLPDDDDADGGPSTGLTGAYAAFIVGWGGTSPAGTP